MIRSDLDRARAVRAWLAEGPTELSPSVLDGVLRGVPVTSQDRPYWSGLQVVPRGGPVVNSIVTMASLGAAAVLVLAVAAAMVLPSVGGPGGEPASTWPSATPRESASPVGGGWPPSEVSPFSGDLTLGRHSVIVDGIRFSFDVPASGWEPTDFDDGPEGVVSLNKSFEGPQDAEAMIYWTTFPDGARTDPCPAVIDPAVNPTAPALAEAMANAPGIRLRTDPVSLDVGGHPATYLEMTVTGDVGCDPGYFFEWYAYYRAAMWLSTDVGETIRVWVVDLDGTPFVVAGLGHGRPGWEMDQEIDHIVSSIQFE